MAVEEAVAAAKKEADQMFFDVLGRKDRADATRNALNVMNRYINVHIVQNVLQIGRLFAVGRCRHKEVSLCKASRFFVISISVWNVVKKCCKKEKWSKCRADVALTKM